MSTTTLAGHALVALVLTIPRLGVWVADATIDAAEAPTGAVDLVLEGRTWRGTVLHGGVEQERWRGRVVGGAGGLARILGPATYADTDLRTVLTETLRDAGEVLSADAGDLSASVARWARAAAPAGHTVADVAQAAGYAWRVRPDGSVWVGVETWEALALGTDLDVMPRDPRAGRHELAGGAALDVVPGRIVTLDGASVRVDAVEHRLDGEALRTVALEARATDAPNRLLGAVESIVRRTMRHTGYHALHPARVVAQDGDGGPLDVEPDDPLVQIPRRVPFRTLPGLAVTVPAGARVLVGFEGGDPRRPYAGLWELGTVTKLVLNGGSHGAAREGHAVRVTIPVGTVLVSSPSGPVPNASPIPLDGTIIEGASALLLP